MRGPRLPAGCEGFTRVVLARSAPASAAGALRDKSIQSLAKLGAPARRRLGPALGGSDLTFSLVLRQIRLTVHTARPSVRVRAADWQQYSGHDAAAVLFQSAQEYDEAFEQGMYRKSALLQQRRRTGG